MNSIEFEWRKLLKSIMKRGCFNKKDDSKVLELLGYHTFIPNPVLQMGPIMIGETKNFLEYLKNGMLNVQDYPMSGESIAKYLMELHDRKCIYPREYEDGFVYTYPERLFAMETYDRISDEPAIIDQMEVIIERLMDNSGSNRAVATLYNCGLDRLGADIPCLNWLQATIRNHELTLHVMFRSNDIYGAWPSNMFFITYIGLLLVQSLKGEDPLLMFKGIDYHVSSAHIYETDLDMVKKMRL